jgi:hypothetical protein
MISIPTGIRPYTPGCADHADDPPTFMMDAIAQRQHDEAVGYSSLDPRTLARPSSGLIDLLEHSHRQRIDTGELPPRSGLNIHGDPIHMGATKGAATASGHSTGHAARNFFDRLNPFRSAHSRAEAARADAVAQAAQADDLATRGYTGEL